MGKERVNLKERGAWIYGTWLNIVAITYETTTEHTSSISNFSF